MVLNNDGVNHHHSSEMSFRITQDGRFFSRIMSKETSNFNSSSRRVCYYGETSVAVPFIWEAQPGTPKHPLSETSLPPLTPPPSYTSTTNYKSNGKRRKNSKVNNMFLTILPRLVCSRKSHVSPSSSSSLSSWSLSSSSSSSSFSTRDGRLSRSPHNSISLKTKFSNGFKGCYPFGSMKNASVSHGGL